MEDKTYIVMHDLPDELHGFEELRAYYLGYVDKLIRYRVDDEFLFCNLHDYYKLSTNDAYVMEYAMAIGNYILVKEKGDESFTY